MQEKNNKSGVKSLSFGCRLNTLEAEKIQKMLAHALDTAIIVNTCAVTAEAERQCGQAVRKLSRENPDAPIFVTGCGATENPTLFGKISNTIVIDNQNKMKLQSYLDALSRADIHITTPKIAKFRPAPQLSKQFIQIQNGCNHRCTYCITRLLRGKSISFNYADILADVKNAIKNGFSEIVLTGVDIASYAKDGMLISDVCKKLLRDVPKIERLRLSSFDPASPEIFKLIVLAHENPKMMKHFHLSVQSGSNEILRAMRRRHTAETLRKIAQVADDDITFSWDIICGFPGETEEFFQETIDLIKETKPIKIHTFPFSPRPKTEAAVMPNQIDRAISKERVKIVNNLSAEIRREFMKNQIGKMVQVLVEQNNIARTPDDLPVKILGAVVAPRSICTVLLTAVKDDNFIGKFK